MRVPDEVKEGEPGDEFEVEFAEEGAVLERGNVRGVFLNWCG